MVDSFRALGIHDSTSVELEFSGGHNSHSHGLLIHSSHHLLRRVGRHTLVTTVFKSRVESFALIITSGVRVVASQRNTILSSVLHSTVRHTSLTSIVVIVGAINKGLFGIDLAISSLNEVEGFQGTNGGKGPA